MNYVFKYLITNAKTHAKETKLTFSDGKGNLAKMPIFFFFGAWIFGSALQIFYICIKYSFLVP